MRMPFQLDDIKTYGEIDGMPIIETFDDVVFLATKDKGWFEVPSRWTGLMVYLSDEEFNRRFKDEFDQALQWYDHNAITLYEDRSTGLSKSGHAYLKEPNELEISWGVVGDDYSRDEQYLVSNIPQSVAIRMISKYLDNPDAPKLISKELESLSYPIHYYPSWESHH